MSSRLQAFYELRRLGVKRVRAEFSGYGDAGCLSRIVTEPRVSLPRELHDFLMRTFYECLYDDLYNLFSFDGAGCQGSYVLNLDDLSVEVYATAPCYEAFVDVDEDGKELDFDLICDERRPFKWLSSHEQMEWFDLANELSS